MSYGITIRNPNQELVISSDAKGLFCIGRAVLQGIVQASGDATTSFPGRTWGYSTYRIVHAGPIIAAIDLPIGKNVGIVSVTEVAASVWDIVCYCGDSPDAYQFDTVQYAVDVWAYGFAPTISGNWGMAIYDAGGNVAWDLSRSNPLFPRGFAVGSISDLPKQIPPLGRPVAMGAPSSDPAFDTPLGVNHWAAVFNRAVFMRADATTLHEVSVRKQRWEYFNDEPVGVAGGDVYPTPSFIIEGSILP